MILGSTGDGEVRQGSLGRQTIVYLEECCLGEQLESVLLGGLVEHLENTTVIPALSHQRRR